MNDTAESPIQAPLRQIRGRLDGLETLLNGVRVVLFSGLGGLAQLPAADSAATRGKAA